MSLAMQCFTVHGWNDPTDHQMNAMKYTISSRDGMPPLAQCEHVEVVLVAGVHARLSGYDGHIVVNDRSETGVWNRDTILDVHWMLGMVHDGDYPSDMPVEINALADMIANEIRTTNLAATCAGFVACTVETHYSAWRVTFGGGETLLLQADYDQAAFAVSCGAIEAPPDWDGLPSKLGDSWTAFDPSNISACPADYLDVAEQGEAL